MGSDNVRYVTEEEVSMELRRLAVLFINIAQDETLTDEEMMNKIREVRMSSVTSCAVSEIIGSYTRGLYRLD